jgi:hypothetical protein
MPDLNRQPANSGSNSRDDMLSYWHLAFIAAGFTFWALVAAIERALSVPATRLQPH